MPWTTLANSTTADAVQVDNNFRYVRQGNMVPVGSATAMTPTDATYDLGGIGTSVGTTGSYRWRDLWLSRSIYAGGQTINPFAGFYSFETPFVSPTQTLVYVPPGKLDINGSLYYNAATQTLTFATAGDWVTSQAGPTLNTFVWVYAVPTTTGSWVAKLDDEQPNATTNSLTTGLYHNGVGLSGSATYRAIHVMRFDTVAALVRYQRRGDVIKYFSDTTTSLWPNDTGVVTRNATITTLTFAMVPNYARVDEIYGAWDYRVTPTTVSVYVDVDLRVAPNPATDFATQTAGTIIARTSVSNAGVTTFNPGTIVPIFLPGGSQNFMASIQEESTNGASLSLAQNRIGLVGYKLRF